MYSVMMSDYQFVPDGHKYNNEIVNNLNII